MANQSTGAAKAPKAARPATSRQRMPESSTTASPPPATMMPVPRSGCMAISPAGTANKTNATPSSSQFGGSGRSWK